MRRTAIAAALCVMSSLAAIASAAAANQYERAAIKTAGIPVDRNLQRAIRELRVAVERKDRTAIFNMLAPKFTIERDFGGLSNPKLSARKQFDIVLPGWEALEKLAAAQTWGPFEKGSRLICGPAPITEGDEKRVMRAARQRGDSEEDYWFEWVYVEGTSVPARDHPNFKGEIVARLSHEAVRTLTLKDGWHTIALPNGDQAYLYAGAAVAMFNDRLCFRSIKGRWRLATYVGGGD